LLNFYSSNIIGTVDPFGDFAYQYIFPDNPVPSSGSPPFTFDIVFLLSLVPNIPCPYPITISPLDIFC